MCKWAKEMGNEKDGKRRMKKVKRGHGKRGEIRHGGRNKERERERGRGERKGTKRRGEGEGDAREKRVSLTDKSFSSVLVVTSSVSVTVSWIS